MYQVIKSKMRNNNCQQQISPQNQQPQLQITPRSFPVSPSISINRPNLLDQAFIVYSDEQMYSLSSIQNSRNSSSSSLSEDHQLPINNLQRNTSLGSKCNDGMILGGLVSCSQQSSILDLRESQCSQSCRELMRDLQPLLNQKSFLRKSPRFTTYYQGQTQSKVMFQGQPKQQQYTQQSMSITKPTPKKYSSQMIEDEKSSPLQIQEQKYEVPTSIFTTVPKNESSFNIFYRQTRSKKAISQEENQKGSENEQSNKLFEKSQCEKHGEENITEYLGKVTKEYVLMNRRKEKRIRKAQKKIISKTNSGNSKDNRFLS